VKDGNKESTKELLAAFRFIAGAALSLALATLAFVAKQGSDTSQLMLVSLFSLTISFLLSIYLFLLAIPMLRREEADIIKQPPIKYTSATSLLTFMVGTGTLAAYLAGVA
jgi:hypothetical protein